MAVLDLQQFKERKERTRKEVERRMRKYKFRLLRVAGPFVAQHTYQCDECIDLIAIGDEYEAKVFVNSKHFWTERKHYPHCYAPTEEEVDEIMKDMDRERDAERTSEAKCA